VDKSFFIPSHYFMAKFARDRKESAFAYPKRFGEEYAFRKRGNARFYVSLGPDYGGYFPSCGNAGKQEPSIEFAHLILNWYEQISSA
jgi:hypothetical protein